MQLQHHLTHVHEQIAAAAALGDERTQHVAAALGTAVTSAVRLALLQAVTEAADEITAGLLDFPGSPAVGVHLDGDEIGLDVHATHTVDDGDQPRRDDGEPTARISLRLSEALKADIDAAAERDGVSVNTWLVRAATAALNPGPFGGGAGGFGAAAFSGGFGSTAAGGGRGRRDQRITGWING